MYLEVIIVLFVAFITCFYSIPIIIKIANKFSIYDPPNHIKKHTDRISYLGGISIMFSFLIAIQLFRPDYIKRPEYSSIYFIILNMMFFYGLGDDIFNFKPIKKLIIQLLLSSILIIKTKLYLPLENLSPLFTINISILITILFVTAIINSINLIDGANGVAGTLTLISATYFSICFYLDNNIFYFFVSISFIGTIIAFLLFNFPTAYIFMGDSGSLFTGMLLATFSLVFINGGISLTSMNGINFNQRIIIGLSSLSIPILDMGRLIIYRTLKGKKPYVGDNNHIHHLLNKIGLNKKQVVFFIVIGQILLLSLSLLNIDKPFIIFILINVCIYIFAIQILIQIVNYKKYRNIQNQAEIQIGSYENKNII
jgi:UDP-N-acetylmuramyl pentapeptide phosphotransferase/UDP-N-acetylglucosamine-1-phosphate transferase